MRHTMSKTRFFVLSAALAALVSRPAAAVHIEEIPGGVANPWGIAFDSKHTRFYAGGSQLASSPVEEPNEVTQPGFGASDLRDMVAAPGGTLWITEPSTGKIWRYASGSGTATAFSVPGIPGGIALGPDGNVWFTEHSGNRIARLTPDGTLWESTLLPTAGSKPGAITPGPDGQLWFVEESANKLGSITASGTITEYPLPTAGAVPSGVAVSSTGWVAITEPGLNKILYFRLSTKAFDIEQTIPTGLAAPRGIVRGSDQAFWFVEQGTSKIGRARPNEPITEFYIPTGSCHPRQIVPGPDGDVWFTEESTGKVGHVVLDSSGDVNGDVKEDVADVFYLINYLFAGGPAPVRGDVMAEYLASGLATPWGIGFAPELNGYLSGGTGLVAIEESGEGYAPATPGSSLRDLAVASDGTGWIVEPSANKIWRVTANQTATSFTAPGTPTGITEGPGGNLWFTEYDGNRIGRLTRDGALWESAPIPTANSHPTGITVGPDGNLWFVEEAGNKLARITPAGAIDEYSLPTAGAMPYGIAISAYGVFAITEPGVNKIAYGNIADLGIPAHEKNVPTPGALPRSIVFAADGCFWFTESQASKIGRFANDFLPILELPTLSGSSHPRQIAIGVQRDLWFTEESSGKVGRVVLHRHGDTDGDGEIQVADVFYLINYLFAGGPAPK